MRKPKTSMPCSSQVDSLMVPVFAYCIIFENVFCMINIKTQEHAYVYSLRLLGGPFAEPKYLHGRVVERSLAPWPLGRVGAGRTRTRRRRRHCGIFARQGSTQENPRKRTKIHTALFSSFILLIICDNWIFIVFFNIKPSNTKNIKCIIFSKSIIDYLFNCNCLTLLCIDFCNSGVSSNILRRNCDI